MRDTPAMLRELNVVEQRYQAVLEVLDGARPGTAQQPQLPEPLVVTRRVSVRKSIMAGGQKIQVGLAHARKTVQVTVGPDTYQVAVETGITVTAARTASRDIERHKASNYSPAASSPG